jgi:hypothetical protein
MRNIRVSDCLKVGKTLNKHNVYPTNSIPGFTNEAYPVLSCAMSSLEVYTLVGSFRLSKRLNSSIPPTDFDLITPYLPIHAGWIEHEWYRFGGTCSCHCAFTWPMKEHDLNVSLKFLPMWEYLRIDQQYQAAEDRVTPSGFDLLRSQRPHGSDEQWVCYRIGVDLSMTTSMTTAQCVGRIVRRHY